VLIFVIVAAMEGEVGEVSSLSLPLELLRSISSNSCGRTSASLGAAAARPTFLRSWPIRSWLPRFAPPHLHERVDARRVKTCCSTPRACLHCSSEDGEIARLPSATQMSDTQCLARPRISAGASEDIADEGDEELIPKPREASQSPRFGKGQ
jgi:hypothetical protein